MEEYLRWFDKKMRGRKVLLLLDNFSGHDLGVQLVGGLEGLENTRIAWLPANTMSYQQPLDQGIIVTFKLYYRRQWVTYMLRQYEKNKDPNKTMTLLKAIQWSRVAWNQHVNALTIQKCFWKSTVIPNPQGINSNISIEDQGEINELQAQIASLPGVKDLMSIEEFIQPVDEIIDDNDDDIIASVVERYSTDKEGEIEEIKDNDIEEEKVAISEAIRALETLKLYEIQQDDGDSITLQALDRLGRDITRRKQCLGKQSTINSFFISK